MQRCSLYLNFLINHEVDNDKVAIFAETLEQQNVL